MSNKDTTEFDEILDDVLMDLLTKNYKTKRDEYGFDVIQNAEEAVAEAREALLLWRDKEVIKELKELLDERSQYPKILKQTANSQINRRITQLQSNLKEKEV